MQNASCREEPFRPVLVPGPHGSHRGVLLGFELGFVYFDILIGRLRGEEPEEPPG